MSRLSLAGSGIAYEPGDSLGFVPRNDPALVEEVLRAAGLDGDAALHAALSERYDITTLTAKQLDDYAALTGTDARSPAELAHADRQFIDLLETAPNKFTADQLTGLLRPLPPRYYSIASSRLAVGDEAHLLIAAVRYETPWPRAQRRCLDRHERAAQVRRSADVSSCGRTRISACRPIRRGRSS